MRKQKQFSIPRSAPNTVPLAESSPKSDELKNIIARLRKFFSRDSRISFALVFGSYAVGEQRRDSDIDVAIYFQESPKGVALLSFLNTLSEVLKKEVDVVVLNTASAFLRHQVMKSALPILIKDNVVYRQFREKKISDYDEYNYVSGMNEYD
jgi:predicted nucleotidyltransferase